MPFEIRRALLADAPHIAHVQVESWRTTYPGIVPSSFLDALDKQGRIEAWLPQLADETTPIFVAEDDAGVFGFISGGAIRDAVGDYDAELYAIYLLQDRQRQGAGRALTAVLAATLQNAGFQSMAVWALEENPSVAFYKRLGAVPVATKTVQIGGKELPDLALGWPRLADLVTPQI
ncbi:MAG TPA: GNAT family N-acetyltransferase [Acidobacteriaceae bacterium]|jgi:GNAT superfamily N-acetyltransferase|nr:GNAT family N-acetyltransferase [Acidobacteriaceae bacterium]